MGEHLLALVTAEDVAHLRRVLPDNEPEALAVIEKCEATFGSYEPDKVAEAQERFISGEGNIEVDDGAVCSRGSDKGLYVQAWVWIEDEFEGDEDGTAT